MLEMDGKYIIGQEDRPEYLIRFGAEQYENNIRTNREWMAKLNKQAVKEGRDLDSLVKEQALYNFRQDEPDLYEINRGIAAQKEHILNDTALYNQAKKDADYYCLPIYNYIDEWAMKLYEDTVISHNKYAIMHDAAWLESVKEKAEKKGISLEEMVEMDARYLYDIKRKKIKP